MASFLRQIVAGPRVRHPEAGLDLCYVTDNIIATSGPSQTYPQRAYRNPLDRLVQFLDAEHGKNWAIWEFRAEGTGYPDELVYNRIKHYPWPDHHPPPFRLVPMIIASMRDWLNGNELNADESNIPEAKPSPKRNVLDTPKDKKNERVVVVHCKAGKGRSGTIACSYLIAECGWTPEEAIARFTERRMRPNFGPGVSIPSQLRWLSYVDRWTKGGCKYVDRELEIIEIHAWGLRHGVRLAVEGFVDQGKKIKVFHTFTRKERQIIEGNAPSGSGLMDMMYEMAGYGPNSHSSSPADKQQDSRGKTNVSVTATNPADSNSSVSATVRKKPTEKPPKLISRTSTTGLSETESISVRNDNTDLEPGGMAVIFKPREPIRIHNSDVNITIERRHRAPKSVNLTMVSAVAHVWFNAFFEGNGPEQDGVPDDTGVFEIEWDKLDGIKGSSQKGTRAADKIAVIWKSVMPEGGSREAVVGLPSSNTPIPEMRAADWKGNNDEDPEKGKHLGLYVEKPDSEAVGEASDSAEEALVGDESKNNEADDDSEGLRAHVPGKEDQEQDSSEAASQIKSDGW